MKLVNFSFFLFANGDRFRRDVPALTMTGQESPDELRFELAKLGVPTQVDRNVRNGFGERRIRQLKVLITWFLQNTNLTFEDFNYGCHCDLVNSPGMLGIGKPVDEIDRACFSHGQCYKCLKSEYENDAEEGECDGNLTGYRAELFKDEATDEPWMTCGNKPGTCRYNICQCDKALAESLAARIGTYSSNYHNNPFLLLGDFEKEKDCIRRTKSGNGNGNGNGGFVECCGDKGTFPFNQPRKENQCCSGHEAKPIGTC